MSLVSLADALTRNHAATSPCARDPRLRTRLYPLPWEAVWNAVLHEVGATPRWTLVSADPEAGEVRAEARTRLWRFVDDVTLRVTRDAPERTRLDAESASRIGRGDLGTNARRIARFLHQIDRRAAQGGG
jgi:uncharacterized protein (DUF1499 family)